jgi:hypothetical protein
VETTWQPLQNGRVIDSEIKIRDFRRANEQSSIATPAKSEYDTGQSMSFVDSLLQREPELESGVDSTSRRWPVGAPLKLPNLSKSTAD